MSDLTKHIRDLVDHSMSARISIKRLKNGKLAVEHTEKIRLAQVDDYAQALDKDDKIIIKVEYGNIVSIERILKKSDETITPN